MVWRIRRSGDRSIQTIKRVGSPAAGLFDRGEWEREIDGKQPDLAAADEAGLDKPMIKKLAAGMAPMFRTVVERSLYQIGGTRWRIKLALDEGQVAARRRSAPICEMELETSSAAIRPSFSRWLAACARLYRCSSGSRARPSAAST